MNIISHLDSLRRHSEWADERMLGALRKAPTPVPTALRELSHIRGAQETWLARLEERAPFLAVWPELTVDELAEAGTTVDAAYTAYFLELTEPELEKEVSYVNSAGFEFTTSVLDCLTQVFIHGQYHRGKVNAAFRAANLEPVGVDFIAWQRSLSK